MINKNSYNIILNPGRNGFETNIDSNVFQIHEFSNSKFNTNTIVTNNLSIAKSPLSISIFAQIPHNSGSISHGFIAGIPAKPNAWFSSNT